jgi:glycerol-3-phosphate O-acyltransferase
MSDHDVLNQSKFTQIIEKMIANSTASDFVTEDNVYQQAKPANKPLVHGIVRDLMLPGSRIVGKENLLELQELARRKKPCLVLMEHYSNFDLPCLFELLERSGEAYKEVADAIVAVAGVKLNEESKLVLAFTEVFTRVVLYPSRGITSIADQGERDEADKRRARLNIAAMKMLNTLRKEGKLILVFPSGTRYRPWDPSTARGLKEIDSYLKFYSHMVLVSINGNTLLPNPHGGMDEDFPTRDVMIYTVSPVWKCSDFRRRALKERPHDADPKQHVVDAVMASLMRLHERTEKARQRLLAELKEAVPPAAGATGQPAS